jgi:hypothetical protein
MVPSIHDVIILNFIYTLSARKDEYQSSYWSYGIIGIISSIHNPLYAEEVMAPGPS